MTGTLVAAIVPIADDPELGNLLVQCDGLETSRLMLFKKERGREMRPPARMHFASSCGSPIASASHGTGVPGMVRTLALNPYVMDAGRVDHLTEIGISSDAAHYYNIAIEEGRGVVAYVTSAEDATSVAARFRACGFLKIRRFRSAEKVAVARAG